MLATEPPRATWLQPRVEAAISFSEIGVLREEAGLKITFYKEGIPVFSFSRKCAVNEELCVVGVVGELRVIRPS